jgi:hypothetical protein
MTDCPICASESGELPKTGDADGYDCPVHGKFKVSGSVFATKQNANRTDWESALERAKPVGSSPWPTIRTSDFDH